MRASSVAATTPPILHRGRRRSPGLRCGRPAAARRRRYIAKVADSIAAEVLQAPVAAIAIAVARGDDVVYRRAYGLSDVAADVPLTVEDEHQIGSLTKQFTAAPVLRLVEERRIALDDPIQKYLPSFDTQGHTVTREACRHPREAPGNRHAALPALRASG